MLLLKLMTAMAILLPDISSLQPMFEKRTFLTKQGYTLPYRILYPENYSSDKNYPVVLFLHGAGERGQDNELQLTHGAELFLKDSNRLDFPAIIIFPQCPLESYWSCAKINRTLNPFRIEFDYREKQLWPLQASISLLLEITKNERVDKNRLYIIGLSMGGMGALEAVARNPGLFAGAISICGGGDVVYFKKTASLTPVWLFHGAGDPVVDVNFSREMYHGLNTGAAEVRYSEYPEVLHDSWENAFREEDFLKWLFDKQKN